MAKKEEEHIDIEHIKKIDERMTKKSVKKKVLLGKILSVIGKSKNKKDS